MGIKATGRHGDQSVLMELPFYSSGQMITKTADDGHQHGKENKVMVWREAGRADILRKVLLTRIPWLRSR